MSQSLSLRGLFIFALAAGLTTLPSLARAASPPVVDENSALADLIQRVLAADESTDYDEIIDEASAYIHGDYDDSTRFQGLRVRYVARGHRLLQPFGGSKRSFGDALAEFGPNVDYDWIVAELEEMLTDLNDARDITRTLQLDDALHVRTKQLVLARKRSKDAAEVRAAGAVPGAPARPSTPRSPEKPTHSEPVPRPEPNEVPASGRDDREGDTFGPVAEAPLLPPAPTPRSTKRDRLARGLGSFFVVAGAAAAAGSVVALRHAVHQEGRGQAVSPVHLAGGVSAALGSSLLLGGGTRMLVRESAQRNPRRERMFRQASWAFLATAGGLAAGSLTLAISGRESFNDARDAAGTSATPDLSASTRSFNTAIVLGGLAVTQLGTFAGIRLPRPATQTSDQRAQRGLKNLTLHQQGLGLGLTLRW